MKRIITLLLVGLVFCSAYSQQNVFNRSNANTGDWGSGNLPWFYATTNNNQGDPDNNNTVRNDVFIGHNNFLIMSLNGRFYIHRDFTFQAGASDQRVLNNTVGGGFSFSRNLINQANVTHIFNTPVGIDGSNAVIQLENSGGGGLTFNGSVFTNGNQIFIRYINGNTGTITFNGPMTQGGSFVKQNGGTLVFTGSADFSGSIFIDEGTVRIGRNLSTNSIEIGGGVQLSTGFNATLEISNGGTIVSKNITVRNFGTGSGNRFITFSHPSSTTASISGNLSLEKSVTITNPNTNNGATISGIISNTGGIVKSGTGILELTAQNTYTGLTTVSQGTLRLNRTGGSTLPSTNNITVASGATLRVSTNQTIQDLNLSAGGNLTIDAGATLTITGTYTPGNGTINSLGTIVLQGSAAQTFPGANTIINNGNTDQLTNLTINNSNGVSLNKAFTVGGTLTLTSGNLNLNTNNLTVNGSVVFTSGYIITGTNNDLIFGATATSTGASSTSHINGNAVKIFAASTVNPSFAFPVGNGTSTTYAPVTFTGTGTTGAQGSLIVSTAAGTVIAPSASGISIANRVGRSWRATNSGISNITSYAATFTYPSGEAAGTPANYIARYNNGTTWSGATISGTPTSTLTSVTGITTNSITTAGVTNQFIIGNAASVSLPTVSIASNNVNSSSRARPGDVVTLTFTSSEAISTPTVTIGGASATVTGGPTLWTASRTMVSGDADGTVAFNIAFSDLAGNAGTAVTTTTNSSSVLFDKTAPTLNSVSFASSNANPARAKVGDVVTLTFAASEAIATPTVTIGGAAATVTGGPALWTASRTMVSGDADGTVAFNISFSDITGNAGTAVTATTDASSVTFDKTALTLNSVSIASNNANPARAKVGDVVTLTFAASEAIATPTVTIGGASATVSGGPTLWTASRTMVSGDADGTVAFNIAFSDITGNAGTAVTATTDASSVTFDKTAPTLNSVTIASNNANPARAKVGDVVTLTFAASEAIATPTVTIGGAAATVTGGPTLWTASRIMLSGDADGTVAFNISFSDITGNAGTAVTATTDASSVTFDKTAPTLNSVTIASSNANPARAKVGDVVTLTFAASEAIATPTVTIGGASATVSGGPTLWTASRTMVSGDADGIVAFNISFSDITGNAGTAVTATTDASSVTFDKTAPVISPATIASNNISNNQQAVSGNIITLSFTSSESLLATPSVTINGGGSGTVTVTNVGGNNWTATKTVTECSNEVVTFSINVSDLAGNTATRTTTTDASSITILPNTFTGTGNWSNNANWSCGAAPGNNFTGTVAIADGANVTLDVNIAIGNGGVLNLLGSTGTFTINPGITLTVNPGTASFNGRPVIIKSDATGTGAIGVIGSNGANLTGATNITAERYIPARRAWRFLTAPLKGSSNNSIFFNWQNNDVTDGSTGVTLWTTAALGGVADPAANNSGLLAGGVASSILSHNALGGTTGAWESPANTTSANSLFNSSNGSNNAYAVFVTGPYSNTNTAPITGAAVATTLRPTGALQQGTVSFSGLTAGKFHLLGNPYASPINLSGTATNTNGSFYIWDAQGGSLGIYRTWDGSTWTPSIPIGSNYSDQPIVQSGQAFFVYTQGGAGTVTLNETNKTSNGQNNVGFRVNNNDQRFRIRLNRFVNNVAQERDGLLVRFDNTYSNNVTTDDIVKALNFTENIMLVRDGKDFVIERRNVVQPNDTLYLRLSNTAVANYEFEVSYENFVLPANTTIVLRDLFLNTERLLTAGQTEKVSFSVTSNAASTGQRFQIVFRTNTVTSVRDRDAAKGFAVFPNPVVKGAQLQLEFRNRAAGKYTVTIFNLLGMQLQQQVIRHNGGTGVQLLTMPGQLSTGTYIAEITSENGVKEQVKIIVQ